MGRARTVPREGRRGDERQACGKASALRGRRWLHRHCWECANATDWQGKDGRCTAYDMSVTRYDSPNNVCSKAKHCYSYREQGKEKE